jgi:hypothetical protein
MRQSVLLSNERARKGKRGSFTESGFEYEKRTSAHSNSDEKVIYSVSPPPSLPKYAHVAQALIISCTAPVCCYVAYTQSLNALYNTWDLP